MKTEKFFFRSFIRRGHLHEEPVCLKCGTPLSIGDVVNSRIRYRSESSPQKLLGYMCESCFKLSGFGKRKRLEVVKYPAVNRGTQLQPASSYCPDCGSQLVHHKNPHRLRWECPNPDCSLIEIRLTRRGNHVLRESMTRGKRVWKAQKSSPPNSALLEAKKYASKLAHKGVINHEVNLRHATP